MHQSLRPPKNWVGLKLLGAIAALVVAMLTHAGPAHAANELISPVYIDYNTFIDRVNVLELVSVGERDLDIRMTVFRSDGSIKTKRNFTIASLSQFDVLVNDLVDQSNTYGIIKIEFDDPRSKLVGRMSVYRANATRFGSGQFSFAFAKELANPLNGTTYVTGNSFNALGQGLLVPNWLEVSNLESTSQTFTHRLYDQAGTLLSTQVVSVPPFGKFDVSSGHERGQGVYLNEIIPSDSSADYLASVTRYASNTVSGSGAKDYAYAMTRGAKAGEGSAQYALTDNRTGSCFRKTSWVEIANVSASAVTAAISFYDQTGEVRATSSRSYPPKSQFHFNAGAVLDEGDLGFAKVESNVSNSLLVQTATYYYSCNSNALQTAYLLPAQTEMTPPLVGSYNLFLDMENELVILSTGSVNRNIDISLRSAGEQIFAGIDQLRPNETFVYDLNNSETFNTQSDTYGTIRLDTLETPSFVPFTIREKLSGTTVDFVLPTLFGESDED